MDFVLQPLLIALKVCKLTQASELKIRASARFPRAVLPLRIVRGFQCANPQQWPEHSSQSRSANTVWGMGRYALGTIAIASFIEHSLSTPLNSKLQTVNSNYDNFVAT